MKRILIICSFLFAISIPVAYAGQILFQINSAPAYGYTASCNAPYDDATTQCMQRGGTIGGGSPIVYYTLMGQACGNGNTSLANTHSCSTAYRNSQGMCGQDCLGTLTYNGELLSASSCSLSGTPPTASYSCQFFGACQVVVYPGNDFWAFVPSSACTTGGGGSTGFALGVTPLLRTINQGDTTTYSVNIYNQYSGTLNLSVTGCPPGASCTFSSSAPVFTSVPTDDNMTLTLTVSNTSSIPSNLYTLNVSGVTNSVTANAAPVQLQVNSLPPSNPVNPTGTSSSAAGNAASCASVNLSWGASTGGSGAITYTIFRNTVNSALSATQITNGLSATTYTNSSIAASTSYYYWVQAVSGGQTSSMVPFGVITTPACSVAGTAPTVSLSSNPSGGTAPMTSTITWTTSNSPTSCTASGAWSGSKTTSGGSQSVTGIPAGSNTFTLSCTNAYGTGSASTNVTAIAADAGAPTVTVTANPTSGAVGMSTMVTWTTTNSPTTCTAFDDWSGAKAVGGGSQVITNLSSGVKRFSIQCTNANGGSVGSATVTVGSSPTTPTATISVSPSTITTGSNTTVIWSSTNSTSCTASGGWSGTKAVSGSEIMYGLTTDTTYTINCTNGVTNSGPISTTVTVVPVQGQCGAYPYYGFIYGPTGNIPINSNFQVTCDSGIGNYLPNNPPPIVDNPYVDGHCTFSNWNGTGAVYNCTAPSNPTRQWMTCGWNNLPSLPQCTTGMFLYYGNTADPIVPTLIITPSSGSGPFTFSWTVSGGATECSAYGDGSTSWSGYKNPLSGSESGKTITAGTHTFRLDCFDTNPSYQRSGSGSATVTVSGASTSYTLNVSKTIGGSVKSADSFINCGAACAKSYNQGTAVTLNAYPDSTQWKFAGWTGDCSGTGTCNLIMNAAKSVKALFILRPLLYQEF